MGEVVKVKVGKGTFWHFQDRFGSKYIPELAMYQQRTLLNSIVVRVTHYKQKKFNTTIYQDGTNKKSYGENTKYSWTSTSC